MSKGWLHGGVWHCCFARLCRRRSFALVFTCVAVYLMFAYLYVSINLPMPMLQEPLQNSKFNSDQVRESNLFIAEDLIHVESARERHNAGLFEHFIPQKPTESQYLQEMRDKLRPLNRNQVAQDDPELIKRIRNYWIRPPSTLPYNLDNQTKHDFSMGQSMVVDDYLQRKRKGFYVECGALDGETRSNTLFFERDRQWSGLLIEAGPINYRKLVKKNRAAYSTPACLSIEPYPNVMYFHRGRNRGRLINDTQALEWVSGQGMATWLMEVQCFPLQSLLLALNRTSIDYFSLDVEGVELDILKTIPFDKVDIRILTVEFAHGPEGKDVLREYMESQGYIVFNEVVRTDGLARDFVFTKKITL